MSYIPKTINEVVTEFINKTTFLPAIQREFVWGTYGIEKLFDSIMGDYPISTFLFWKIKEENKNEWAAYDFIRDFSTDDPHNKDANLAGVNQDVYFVLDGQQRLTSLYIGLKGSYRYFYYRWYKTKLYLNLLKEPTKNENPEELTYQFEFRENDSPNPKDPNPQFWYLVGSVLDFEDAEDAKKDVKSKLSGLSESQKDTANIHIGRLHSRINTARLLNYYEEKSQDYDKVVEAFIRANTGGVKLEYSDILLSTATAKWSNLNAREEINSFTDNLNAIGSGYTFGKDFVLKGSLYLTEDLPIQYRVKNFTKTNLAKIESNWDTITDLISQTVGLVDKFGFNDKNIVAKIALLPIAYYLGKIKRKDYVNSTVSNDVINQVAIQKWLVITLLKNSFGGSSDTILKNLQQVIKDNSAVSDFPYKAMFDKLNVVPTFSDNEIDGLLLTNYSSKYSYLILSLLYPDRDWKGTKFEEDHIFPKTEFTVPKLKARGYDDGKIKDYMKYFNTIVNLELLTDSENRIKSSQDFDAWISTRDSNFKTRHSIPNVSSYNFDDFLVFAEARRNLLKNKLAAFTM